MSSNTNISKSKLDIFQTREEVALRKLAKTAFDQVALDALVDVDIASPDQNDSIFYNLALDQWENDSFKTVNGQSLRGTGDITITTSGALSGLSDVTITTPLNNQVLTYNGSLSRWENQSVPGGASSLDDLTDVSIVSPTSNQALAWDAVAMEWINTDGSKIVPAAGGNNEIQYNNGSDEFAANANFTFNPSTQTLTVDNIRSNQYLNTGTSATIFGTGNANPVLLTTEFLGTTGVANLSVPASNGSALREFKLQSNWNEPRFFDGVADRNVLHAGNIKTVGGESIIGSGDIPLGGTPAASAVTYDNTTSGLTATDVQSAIDEVAGASPVIPDDQVVRALSNSFALKIDHNLYSPSGSYFDVTFGSNSASASAHSRAFRGASGGKWYFEIRCVGTIDGGSLVVGVAQPTTVAEGSQLGSSGSGATQSWGVLGDGRKYSGSVNSYGSAIVSGDVVMCAVDMSLAVGSRKIWLGKNGTWFASGDPAAGTNEAFANLPLIVCPGVTPSSAICTLRLRSSEFSHSPPTGFSPWVT